MRLIRVLIDTQDLSKFNGNIPTDYGPEDHILWSPRQTPKEIHDLTEYGNSIMCIRTFITNWIGLKENEEEVELGWAATRSPIHRQDVSRLLHLWRCTEELTPRRGCWTSSRNHHQSYVHLDAMKRKIVMLSRVLPNHRRVKSMENSLYGSKETVYGCN